MSDKRVSIAAINALKDALTAVYWYKDDLKRFLRIAITNHDLISRLDWDTPKRNIVTSLVEYMATHQNVYQGDLVRLIAEVSQIRDFQHLERLEEGPKKVDKARHAVDALCAMYKTHENLILNQEHVEDNRRRAYERQLQNQGVREKLESLYSRFNTLVKSDQAQSRGYALETIINDLFALFDLDPRASYKASGEQVDGAFTFEGTDFLLKAKWQKSTVDIGGLDSFHGKLTRKLDNTLGLFISVSGFSAGAIGTQASGRRMMILMDGADLIAVLEARINLPDLLLRKRRHAAQTGEIFLPVQKILYS